MRGTAAIRALAKPQYVFRPSQIVRRVLWRVRRGSGSDRVTVRLPWGMPIRCFARDTIGLSIQQLGVFDLVVSETLWRLADAGELALDVGANVGQMTAVLARRVGPSGRVMAFEPNADVRGELEYNAGVWRDAGGAADIQTSSVALSDHAGAGELTIPPDYKWNRGVAKVELAGAAGIGERRPIQLARLDDLVPAPVEVGVMKMDVEGHEAAVLRGAEALLTRGCLRDIVYEDHGEYPTGVSRILQGAGYRVFAIGATFWGPTLDPPGGPSRVPSWESPSFLATRDPARAAARLGPRGWRIL